MHIVLLLAATVSLLALFLITAFVVGEGWPVMVKHGPLNLILGTDWTPSRLSFGMLPQLTGTLLVTLGALLIAVPLGVGCAIFLAELSSEKVANLLRPCISLLAAVPSVVYGFLGIIVLVPLLRSTFGGSGYSLLAGSIVLAIMILPSIINISEDTLRALPIDYREASLALGSTRWQTIWRVLLPAARPGIVVSIILAMGRAIGETMAVMMVTGNRAKVTGALLDPGVTMAGTIGLEWSYAADEHSSALFALGTFLFIVIMLLNGVAQLVTSRGRVSQ
ncbi:MAG TPA: phosphate ABC transporter permease subunit PstC [Firmicutes bacterium]|nr:phosphate ABC transporter permease subunit PstC [Bacillota bacterium]